MKGKKTHGGFGERKSILGYTHSLKRYWWCSGARLDMRTTPQGAVMSREQRQDSRQGHIEGLDGRLLSSTVCHEKAHP